MLTFVMLSVEFRYAVIMFNVVVLSNVMQCDMLRFVILHVYRRSVVILSVEAPSKCLNKELIEPSGNSGLLMGR
jgi:hypothetical protein